jgi:hypothetical protein
LAEETYRWNVQTHVEVVLSFIASLESTNARLAEENAALRGHDKQHKFWRESVGVTEEIKIATGQGMLVRYLAVGEVKPREIAGE